MVKAKRFMDGGAIPNTYPFANQNIPAPADSVQVGVKPEPLSNVIAVPNTGPTPTFKQGGVVKSSASKRGDGCANKGKTKGRMV